MSKGRSYAEIVSEAENAVASVTDPELKKVAFQRVLDGACSATPTNVLDSTTKMIQVISVALGVIISVIGVMLSVLSFNAAQQAEAQARVVEAEARKLELTQYQDQQKVEAEKRHAEAAKPYLELRQKLYLEAVDAAGVLANPKDHAEDELKKARMKFRQLYVANLSLVEGIDVARKMNALAAAVDPELTTMTPEQRAAYQLAHALRDSLVKSWKIDESVVDNPSH